MVSSIVAVTPEPGILCKIILVMAQETIPWIDSNCDTMAWSWIEAGQFFLAQTVPSGLLAHLCGSSLFWPEGNGLFVSLLLAEFFPEQHSGLWLWFGGWQDSLPLKPTLKKIVICRENLPETPYRRDRDKACEVRGMKSTWAGKIRRVAWSETEEKLAAGPVDWIDCCCWWAVLRWARWILGKIRWCKLWLGPRNFAKNTVGCSNNEIAVADSRRVFDFAAAAAAGWTSGVEKDLEKPEIATS